MSEVILCKKKSDHSLLSNAQKTFNRLKKKIEVLQSELQKRYQQLDQSLLFYHEKIEPEKKAWRHTLQTFVKLVHEHYQKPKHLSQKERHILNELMMDKIGEIFESTLFNEIDPEISAIFKDLSGFSYEEMASKQLSYLKEELQEMCKENGVDIDLSHIEVTDDEHEIQQKLFEAMHAAGQNMEEQEEPATKSKTKKQLQKEAKAQELEELQKKGISTIYKQLAKVFHPDLEHSPERKLEKEQLMKRLTSAYENNDLHTLLTLEMEWMNQSEEEAKAQSDEQLKIYNSILKDQVETLQESIGVAVLHPKYLSIQPYLDNMIYGEIFILKMVHNSLREEVRQYQNVIKRLQGSEAMKIIRAILRDYAAD